MATDQDEEAPGNQYALLIGLLLVAMVAAAAFGRVYQGTDNTFRLMLAGVVATLLAHALAHRHVLLATAVSAAGLLVAIGLLVFPDTTVWALPSVDTLRAIGRALGSVGREAALTVAPAPPVAPLLLAGVIAVWTAAFAAHSLAARARSPFLSLLPGVSLLAFAGIVVEDGTRPAYVVVFLLGSLTVLFADAVRRVGQWGPVTVWHGRRFLGMGSRTTTRGAWRVAGACLGIAVFLPGLLPGFGAQGVLRLRGGSAQTVSINPIVDIRPRLIDNPPALVFTVKTERASYWRLVPLDDFDGRTWTPADPQFTHGISVASGPLPLQQAQPTTGEGDVSYIHQHFEFGRVAQPWLPSAYQPADVSLSHGVLKYDASESTLILPDLTFPGLSYDLTSQVVAPTREELAAVPTLNQPAAVPYTHLPQDTPELVYQIARAWSAQGTTPYGKIMEIQQHLRGFTYDLHVAAPKSTNDLLYFLARSHRGYCEQFAGSMAVLLRALGYPARVAVGFTPGTYDPKAGVWRVETTDAHAWVEVLFPGYGWLAFEPTPTRNNPIAARYDVPPPNLPFGGAAGCLTINPRDGTCADAGGTSHPTKNGPTHKDPDTNFNPVETNPIDSPGFQFGVPAGRNWVRLGLFAVAILLVVAFIGVPTAKGARRRIAVVRATKPAQRILAAYRVLLDRAADVGVGRAPAETIREYGTRLSGTVRFSNGDFQDLSALAGRAAYGSDDLTPSDADRAMSWVRQASRDIRGSVGGLRLLLGIFRIRRRPPLGASPS